MHIHDQIYALCAHSRRNIFLSHSSAFFRICGTLPLLYTEALGGIPHRSGYPPQKPVHHRREFDSWIIRKVLAGYIKPAFFVSIFLLLYMLFSVIVWYNKGKEVLHMNLHISKSKNAESFYICKSYVKANGSTSSMIVRKLGTLEQLLIEHSPTRDDVLAWSKKW